MALILNIDTSVESASFALAKDGHLLTWDVNADPRKHTAWLHERINQLMTEKGIQMSDLEAVAVTIGPGSYTGLRVGLATAKGICFALQIPLITVGTLTLMAAAVRENVLDLSCPMIDARRMEIFTAIYSREMKEVLSPRAMIVERESFIDLLANHKILFSGNGRHKLAAVIQHPNAVLSDLTFDARNMIALSENYHQQKTWADLAYTEPVYLKEFYLGN